MKPTIMHILQHMMGCSIPQHMLIVVHSQPLRLSEAVLLSRLRWHTQPSPRFLKSLVIGSEQPSRQPALGLSFLQIPLPLCLVTSLILLETSILNRINFQAINLVTSLRLVPADLASQQLALSPTLRIPVCSQTLESRMDPTDTIRQQVL